ncbi:hypothetical protein CCHR01_18767 [Colletotrichum chrysophilum]|uniref:Alpha beta hydrolase fold protein n=1 Tax=Colletotrichum chrysophilum TaxID=1836956 RepID=A0AAD8ZZW5_9PEZI|nr:hypothetical protein CCHR01_18767 [Colletotrichum chrysophilum]
MPVTLDQVEYSEATTVAAVTDFYAFLTKMYLPESAIVHPPPGGWPTLTSDLSELGKSDEVLSLLAHLPYVRQGDDLDEGEIPEVTPGGRWIDWHTSGIWVREGRSDIDELRTISEGPAIMENVPEHVVGLTMSEHHVFLLDTELGVVYWPECPGRLRDGPRCIEDDPYDYCDDDEDAEWRADGAAWSVADFFKVLKAQYRTLRWVPWNEYEVLDSESTTRRPIPALQEVFRRHGWPNSPQYRKEDCLEETKAVMDAAEQGGEEEGSDEDGA